ncbi:MAG: hypothetical protein IAE89_02605 [Anaerolineae bacterium]|nr:hypothetical protein [Anaerolineae bacterium]
MRLRIVVVVGLLVTVLAACQGPPPTVVYVITSTPDTTEETTIEVTSEATVEVTEGSVASLPTPIEVTLDAVASVPASSALTPTALPSGFPTPIAVPIQYAEQLFENGRMFWLQPIGQIWVLIVTGEGRGTWSTYEDTFIEGEAESDPSLVPPEDNLQQPVRGFGKLWRTNEEVQNALGWAVNPEFGYVESYEYHAGGNVDASGGFTPEPGYHIIYSLYGERFRLNEADGTWVLGG